MGSGFERFTTRLDGLGEAPLQTRLFAKSLPVTVTGTVDGDGLQVDDTDAGNLDVIVFGSTLVGNDGDDIDLEETGPGTGTFRLQASTVSDIKLTGVTQV